MTKVIIIGAGGAGKLAYAEIKMNLENNSAEIINITDSEKSEIKELADQLNTLTENENRIMRDIQNFDFKFKSELDYIENKKGKKGYERPYKFHK